MEDNEYSDLLDQEQGSRSASLKQSMYVASQQDPGKKAEILKLSDQTSLPPEVVERNFDEVKKKNEVDSLDYDSLIDSYPKTAKWLEHPDNLSVAKDQINEVTGVEKAVNDHSFNESLRNWLGAGFAQMNADISKIPALAYDVAAYPLNKFNEAIGRDVRISSDQIFFGRNNPVTQKFEKNAQAFRNLSPELSKSLVAEVKKGNYAEAGKALLAQTIANAPQQVLLLASGVGGFAEEGLIFAGATSAANKNAQNLSQGIDPTVGLPNAVATGTLESAFENVGTFGFLKNWEGALEKNFGKQVSKEVIKAYGKTLAHTVIGEGTEEGLTSAAQDLTDYATGVNKNALKGIGQRAIEAGIIGAVSGGAMTGPIAAGGHVLKTRSEMLQAQNAKNFYLSLGKTLEASKLRERLPRAQKELIEQITKDSPVENIIIPTAAAESYFQSKGLNTTQVLGEMGLQQAYDDAKETGLDLRIPLSTFADKLGGTEHYEGLADDIKFSADSKSLNEIKEEREKQKALEDEIKSQVKEASKTEPSDEIENQIAEQLKASGVYDERTSKTLAQVYRGFSVLGERAGVNPQELFSRIGLKINGPDEANAAQASEDNKTLNQLSDDTQVTDSNISIYGNVPSETPTYASGEQEFLEQSAALNTEIEALTAGEQNPESTARLAQLTKQRSQLVMAQQNRTAPGGMFYQGNQGGDKGSENSIRGRIRFGKDGQFNIDLFKKADFSTFLHETGHLYLEVIGDLTEREGVPDLIKQDYQTILKFLGVDSRDQIKTEHHEKFARSFESYLMEGKAPSSALREAFGRFKKWLLSIYKTATNLNVELSPEIRGVFDRLLASDEEINQAQVQMDTPLLFNDPINMGMSEKKAYEYMSATAFAKEAAERELDQKLMAEVKREQTSRYKEQREKVRAEVLAEANQRKEFIALSVLQKGVMPDGSELPKGMRAPKLSKTQIVDRYGVERLKALPRPYVYTKEGGISLQTAAEMFGFTNPDELLSALESSGKKDDYVERATDERMKKEFGDLRTDGKLPQEALNAIHNDKRAHLLRMELEHLISDDFKTFKEVVRRVSRPIPKIEEVRSRAQEIIGSMKVDEIKPVSFERAQSKLAKQAVELMLKGDLDGAFDAKMKELLNHELHRAATSAIEQVDKTVEYMKKFRKESKRAQLGRTDYLDQIDNILARFEFARVPQKELERREKALADWIAQKERDGDSLGEEIVASDQLKNEGFRTNYKNLSFDDLVGIRDTVKQIEHMAIQSDKSLSAAKKARREDIKAQLISSLIANTKKRNLQPFTKAGTTAGGRFLKSIDQFDSSLLKTEQLIDWMDGGDISGAWHEYLWHPVSDAQNAEYDYTAAITAKLAKLILGMPKEIRAKLSDEIVIPGIERKMVRRDLIGVALNVGNDSNYQKLLNGHGWSEDQVRLMLDHLSQEEWNLVQGIWDTLESMWPDIAKLQKELTGLAPDKVAIRPVTTKFGKLKGGYYPLIYDHVYSTQGELQLGTRVGGLLENSYTRATTPKGHTKSRVEQFSAPIDLDLDNLTGHIAGVIKDLTHRKWLIDANWMISDRDIRQAIAEHMGEEKVKQISDWVKQVVNDRNHSSASSLSAWRKAVEHFRYNTAIAAMGFKASVMISQLAGAANSLEVIGGNDLDGAKWFTIGAQKALSHPMDTFKMVTEKSGEMRHRFETRDRDLRDNFRSLEGKEGILPKIHEVAMYGIGAAEMLVSLPTWVGAYEKAISQGMSEDLAIRAGDRAVRLSQGAAGAKDLAHVMNKNNELMRLLTMFYTPFSALYARLRDVGHDFAGGEKNIPSASFRLFMLVPLAATIASLGSGQGPDDDKDESWLKWFAKNSAIYPFMTIPIMRDMVNYVAGDYGYTFTPLEQAIKTSIKPIKTAQSVVEGDKEIEDLAKDTFKASGYWLGLPTAQIGITGSYLYDIYNGSEDPNDIGEFAKNMVMRRPQK